jgi:diaminopropionate ammonia-lyase
VTHYKGAKQSQNHSSKILTVEPETAATLHTSLQAGERVNVETYDSAILKHLNYGNVAEKTWEVLRGGVDVSTVVTDEEVRNAIEDLRKDGVEVGPCDGAVLAGLKNVLDGSASLLKLDQETTVVLIGT